MDTDNNGIINAATEIIEESNYYPFGLKHRGYNDVVSSNGNSVAQKKKFQGQEYEEDLRKNTYAYQWRDYDPALGRFFKIDRFAEKYESITPYHFAANNPIFFKEINGDSIQGVTRKSARRAKRIIRRTFKKNKKIAKLFKKKGKTFKKISQEDFDEATNGASRDVVALAKGYFDAINSSEMHTVEVGKLGEKVQSKSLTGIVGASRVKTIDKNYGPGFNYKTSNGSHTFIVMDSNSRTDYQINSKIGGTESRLPSAGELVSHELIGHGLAHYNSAGNQFLNAIQVGNLYLRVTSGTRIYRNGSYHGGNPNGEGKPIPGNLSWLIPSYLK